MKKEGAKTKVCNKNLHQIFVKILLKSPITNIQFPKERISLSFFNHRISDKITIKREAHVAE